MKVKTNQSIPFRYILWILIFSLSFLISCGENSPEYQPPVEDPFEAPEQTNDGWETAKPSEAHLNPEALIDMIEYINQYQNHGLHSVLIFKDNKLVFERYYEGYLWDSNYSNFQGDFVKYDRNTLHYLASVSKSVTSVLFGIARDKGLVESVEIKVMDYYPQFSSIFVGEKENISIKNLLTMTSGLAWDENTYPYGDPRNNVSQMFEQSNPIRYILALPMISNPGESFHYNSGNTNIIADIIKIESEVNLKVFAEENLFDPLGIDDYQWDVIRGNYVFASGGLFLTPRSLAKIGSLFLNEGKWKDTQIISQDWINESIESYIDPPDTWANGYGYQWWMTNFNADNKLFNCFLAAGWGGQYMFMFPQEKLIAVFNCGYYTTATTIDPFYLVENYILDSLN
ncbi:MAG: serine hydrolase [bacterium]